MYFSFLSRDNERQIRTGHTALFVLQTRILYINYQKFMMWYLSRRNSFKGRCKRGNIVAEAKLGPRRKFCVFNMCCVGSQTRKHFRNTEEALIFNVSRLFLRLRAKATCSEDAEFASGKQKCFASFPFAL